MILLFAALVSCGGTPAVPEGFLRVGDGFESPSGLRFRFDAHGVSAANGDASVRLQTRAWGREGAWTPAGAPVPVAGEGRLEANSGGLTRWVSRGSSGPRLGWELAHRPPGGGSLLVDLAVLGAEPRLRDAQALSLLGPEATWRFDGLRAWDAEGRALPARFEVVGGAARVEVDDADATYPVHIDPDLALESVELSPDTLAYGAEFGIALTAADINGDAFDDLIVGAVNSGGWTEERPGRVHTFFGGSGGVDPGSERALRPSVGATDDGFGREVAGVGDVNGDGFADVLVGAPYFNSAAPAGGAAYLLFGSALGLDADAPLALAPSLLRENGTFGDAVGGGGDFNGDGLADLVVGASGVSDKTGEAHLFLGEGAGAFAAPIRLATSEYDRDAHMGVSVSLNSDLNDDGFDDLIVGVDGQDDDAGAIAIWFGRAEDPESTPDLLVSSVFAASNLAFGHRVAVVGDLDGDGYDDLAVGAPSEFHASDAGWVHLFYGADTQANLVASERRVQASGLTSKARFGSSVAAAGDVDGDGYDDFVIGARSDRTDGVITGEGFVLFGAPDRDAPPRIERLDFPGASAADHIGAAAAGGDFDGDDLGDAAVGAYGAGRAADNAGAVRVYYGACEDLDADGVCASDDCDDNLPSVGLPQPEVCNDLDDDCDGQVDEGASDASTFFRDADADGFPVDFETKQGCAAPTGFIAPRGDGRWDCDDVKAGIHPDAQEVCDEADNDCDGRIDDLDDDVLATMRWYADADSDGFQDKDTPQIACKPPPGHAALNGKPWDCDDARADVNPDAADVCNGVDDDCDGVTDPDCDSDTDDTSDTVDTGDTDDTGDTSDTVDTGDSSDTGDTGDGSDTVDTGDSSDTGDTSDTVDTSDTSDTVDTSDTSDTDDSSPLHPISQLTGGAGCQVAAGPTGAVGWLLGLVGIVARRRR